MGREFVLFTDTNGDVFAIDPDAVIGIGRSRQHVEPSKHTEMYIEGGSARTVVGRMSDVARMLGILCVTRPTVPPPGSFYPAVPVEER